MPITDLGQTLNPPLSWLSPYEEVCLSSASPCPHLQNGHTASVPFLVAVIKGYLKKEGFVWGLWFEGTVHPGKEQDGRSWSRDIYSQEEESKEYSRSASFLLLTVQTPTQGLVLSFFRVELSTPINLMKIILQRHA